MDYLYLRTHTQVFLKTKKHVFSLEVHILTTTKVKRGKSNDYGYIIMRNYWKNIKI